MTPADAKNETASISYMLGQLTSKVDLLLDMQKRADARHEDLDKRVTVLEKDRAKIVGGAVALSGIAGLAIDYMLK